VAEEEDVSGRGTLPGVEGEGEEVLEGLGGGFAEAEEVVDVLDGHGSREESLALPQVEQGPGRREEVSRCDEEVVGPVARVPEVVWERPADLGAQEGGGGHGEVTVLGLGVEAQPTGPEARAREPAGGGVGRVQHNGAQVEAGDVDGTRIADQAFEPPV